MFVFGTRPEAIKVAPVVIAAQRSADLKPVLVITGQHRSMIDQVLAEFALSVDYDFDLRREGDSLLRLAGNAMGQLSELIDERPPSVVVVQGDTLTAVVAAFAAFYRGVPVAHIEAGLRTENRKVPYPEEVNRRMITQLTDFHFAPTALARENLLRDGVEAAQIMVTGNTVVDALLMMRSDHAEYADPRVAEVDASGRRVLLVTAHRRESWLDDLDQIGHAVARIAAKEPDLTVVLPLHVNPIVRDALLPIVGKIPNVIVTEPMGYRSFTRLLARASVALTDSGGIQEEGPGVGTPVVVMRDETERTEGVQSGGSLIVGCNQDKIVDAVLGLLRKHGAKTTGVNPYGDGHASERVLDGLRHYLMGGPRPAEFAAAGA